MLEYFDVELARSGLSVYAIINENLVSPVLACNWEVRDRNGFYAVLVDIGNGEEWILRCPEDLRMSDKLKLYWYGLTLYPNSMRYALTPIFKSKAHLLEYVENWKAVLIKAHKFFAPCEENSVVQAEETLDVSPKNTRLM